MSKNGYNGYVILKQCIEPGVDEAAQLEFFSNGSVQIQALIYDNTTAQYLLARAIKWPDGKVDSIATCPLSNMGFAGPRSEAEAHEFLPPSEKWHGRALVWVRGDKLQDEELRALIAGH